MTPGAGKAARASQLPGVPSASVKLGAAAKMRAQALKAEFGRCWKSTLRIRGRYDPESRLAILFAGSVLFLSLTFGNYLEFHTI